MAVVRRLLGIALFVGALWGGWTFAGNNAGLVEIHYLAGISPSVPLWMALTGSFAAGAVLTGLLMTTRLCLLYTSPSPRDPE